MHDGAVRAETVRLLYQSPFPALANLVVATLLVAVAWEAVPGAWLVAWLAAMALATGVRLALWRAFARSGHAGCGAVLWERRMLFGVTVVGLLWAATGAAVAAVDLPIQVEGVVAISVGGMIAGAMFSMTASAAVFRAYVIPAALGPIVGFMAVGDRDHVAVAGMGLVYLLVVLLWGRSAERAIVNGIRLRLQNEALVADLKAARDRADAAEKLKQESFANLGHELRTPLNAIIGFAQSLEIELWGPLGSPRYREYAHAIGSSGRHLYELIQGILDIARHDAGILELDETRVELAGLVGNCVGMMEGAARSKGVTLSANADGGAVAVLADATKLRQILINLLANAVRFTPSGGRVTVATRLRDGGGVEIEVRDTGIGLAAEDIPRALEPFVQVGQAMAGDSGGAGLGLPLSKRLAELHGGRLEIDSNPGDGTAVRVVLPAARVVERQ
ncbi:hypothetical protein GCM10017083_18670 [Thalassobaculum fulvum]|uniref:histidine kinase n=1 Tax=Thalassobaculum fulvum TaxID=1633335 RepID=A0A918XQQ7_9PROT|nr:hypothetical protein GCM10017083_18670 [Thalassobaculum fulvum]